MSQLLAGKSALVTGGTRGIGEAIVRKFAGHGANVAFTYRSSDDKANALADEIAGEGITVKPFQSDAASFQEAEQLIGSVLQEFGTIDVVVNNAGITRDNLLLRMTEEHWDDVIQTNLKSVFNITKNVTKQMLKQKHGSIINISSIIGIEGHSGQSNYAASKAGIIGFTKSTAHELGSRNIRCNAIAPGFIETDMTQELDEETRKAYQKEIPMERLGSPEEVANSALFLASDLSSYVSGQVLSVCGAMHR